MRDWSETISPSDAVVALRSFPRRWRGLLARVEDEEDLEGVVHRRPPDGSPSVHDLMVASRDRIAAAAQEVQAILGLSTGTPPVAVESDVDSLAAAAEDLARRVAAAPGDEWGRTGPGGTTALDVVRRAVAAASDDLRQAERTLGQVTGRPG